MAPAQVEVVARECYVGKEPVLVELDTGMEEWNVGVVVPEKGDTP